MKRAVKRAASFSFFGQGLTGVVSYNLASFGALSLMSYDSFYR